MNVHRMFVLLLLTRGGRRSATGSHGSVSGAYGSKSRWGSGKDYAWSSSRHVDMSMSNDQQESYP
jgi:hypothetical protein